ncbi:hypothetical protein CMI42_00795 [Candidatus Pacearchaeota archaeon]|nr:hypothetical protein [Candidatus Pacearchaeota archaeon]|tara:strand:+ start:33 stop:722 length:690 start_codon:yes stop_codon:yes gene_type:complete
MKISRKPGVAAGLVLATLGSYLGPDETKIYQNIDNTGTETKAVLDDILKYEELRESLVEIDSILKDYKMFNEGLFDRLEDRYKTLLDKIENSEEVDDETKIKLKELYNVYKTSINEIAQIKNRGPTSDLEKKAGNQDNERNDDYTKMSKDEDSPNRLAEIRERLQEYRDTVKEFLEKLKKKYDEMAGKEDDADDDKDDKMKKEDDEKDGDWNPDKWWVDWINKIRKIKK